MLSIDKCMPCHFLRIEENKKLAEEKRKKEYVEKWGNYLAINFYEWGDINSTPKLFYRDKSFFERLDEWKIPITEELRKACIDNENKSLYITCAPLSTELLISTTKYGLNKLHDEYEVERRF